MKLSQFTLISALLATSAFAAPQGQKSRGFPQRVQRRAADFRRSGPRLSRPTSDSHAADTVEASNKTNTDYSANWSGAILESPPTDETFTGVSATFTVPNPTIPTDIGSTDDSSYAASAWVGIDGDTYSTAILQTGVDFTVSSSGEVSYDAWYEWYPDYAYDFSGIDINAGDSITLSVVAATSTTGTATIENLSTGQTVIQQLTSTSALGGRNAEWIVEDFQEGDSLVPFADFGDVEFTDATATTTGGTVDLSGATIVDIESTSGSILTDASVSGSTVSVSYV